jgi:uncharacterized Zn finger protein
MTSTRSLERRKETGYRDFFDAVRDLKALVADMRRITKPAKDDALLLGRRVDVLEAGPHFITALVRGDSATYRVQVRWEREVALFDCECAAHGECSHVKAVKAVKSGTMAVRSRGQEGTRG